MMKPTSTTRPSCNYIMEYNHETKTFNLLDQDDIIISCEFIFSDKNKDGEIHNTDEFNNFIVKIVHKENVPENEIRKVKSLTKDDENKNSWKRIGWIIPLSSLISLEHDFCDDIHFGYYAFYAYIYLLNNNLVKSELKKGLDFSTALNNIYLENKEHPEKNNAVIFICYKANIPDLKDLDCFDFSLYKHGYYKKNSILNPKYCISTGDTIKLDKRSELFYTDNKHYLDLFLNELYFETNQNIRFFILYQIIEITIDDILINNLQKQLDNYKIGKGSTRGQDSIIKTNTELERIRKMIELSGISHQNHNELNIECNNYLKAKGHDEVDFPESLYYFRNMITHRFRWVIKDQDSVKNINDLMENFVFDILTKYKSGS